jgi:DNA-directed RNA polymerase specialized sigma24 family protein
MRTVERIGMHRPRVRREVDADAAEELFKGVYPRLRDPFLLHYYGGFGLKEVASLLHRPEGTIKADLFAARARLQTALGERDG